MSSNDPFGANTHNPYNFSDTPQVQLPPDLQRGLVHHMTALSILTIAGCYCLPTAIGLFIYGLIVLLNPSVKRAFEMGEQGYSANKIQNHFARLPG